MESVKHSNSSTNGHSINKENDREARVNQSVDSRKECCNVALTKALLKKADLLLKLDRDNDAVNTLDQILSHYEKSSESKSKFIVTKTLLRKAEVLEKTQQFDQALLVYEEYIQLIQGRLSKNEHQLA